MSKLRRLKKSGLYKKPVKSTTTYRGLITEAEWNIALWGRERFLYWCRTEMPMVWFMDGGGI